MKKFFSKKGDIVGRRIINSTGNNVIQIQSNKDDITIINGEVFVSGKKIEIDGNAKEITINIQGIIAELNVDYCNYINIEGDVSNIKSTSGDVFLSDALGDIQTTSGDVEVKGGVSGSIKTVSGDVDCVNCGGSISTVSGDIKYKK